MAVDWTDIGSITVGPSDLKKVVGSFNIDEGDNAIWIDVQATTADDFWPWSYGILSWETSFGREFGSSKAYTEKSGEVVRLGVGRAPRSRRGSVIYEPRSFNLGWIKKGNKLDLSFRACSGSSASAPSRSSVAFPVVGGTWKYASTGLLQLEL